ncbi:MAG: SDR family NAD(P)-dependent oxidoreductase, partial [Rhodospirillaceae bacterium]|nr:SDR family NAD(P)-dependent oxidoreductase [Rhodospirillaceae bacterium]
MNEQSRPSAIVTAASQGIGAACACDLAKRGYRLTIMARSELIHEVARETGAIAIQGDVTKPKDLERLVDQALQTHGRIDAVVANTGLSRDIGSYTGKHYDKDNDDSVTDYDDLYWTDMFDLQYMFVVRLARLLTPQMQKQGQGAFVNISAMISKEPHAAYASSSIIRRALDGYTKLYADRHARDGIRMNTVSPG